jgi:hypothetical protein
MLILYFKINHKYFSHPLIQLFITYIVEKAPKQKFISSVAHQQNSCEAVLLSRMIADPFPDVPPSCSHSQVQNSKVKVYLI